MVEAKCECQNLKISQCELTDLQIYLWNLWEVIQYLISKNVCIHVCFSVQGGSVLFLILAMSSKPTRVCIILYYRIRLTSRQCQTLTSQVYVLLLLLSACCITCEVSVDSENSGSTPIVGAAGGAL